MLHLHALIGCVFATVVFQRLVTTKHKYADVNQKVTNEPITVVYSNAFTPKCPLVCLVDEQELICVVNKTLGI